MDRIDMDRIAKIVAARYALELAEENLETAPTEKYRQRALIEYLDAVAVVEKLTA